jgi:hypothetical protein
MGVQHTPHNIPLLRLESMHPRNSNESTQVNNQIADNFCYYCVVMQSWVQRAVYRDVSLTRPFSHIFPLLSHLSLLIAFNLSDLAVILHSEHIATMNEQHSTTTSIPREEPHIKVQTGLRTCTLGGRACASGSQEMAN